MDAEAFFDNFLIEFRWFGDAWDDQDKDEQEDFMTRLQAYLDEPPR